MYDSVFSLMDAGRKLAKITGGFAEETGNYICSSSTGKACWYDRYFPIAPTIDIDAALAYCADQAHPMWLTFACEDFPNLSKELESRGYKLGLPAHAGMVYKTGKTFDEDIEVIAIDKSHIDEWDRVRAASYGCPTETELYSKILESDGTYFFGAVADGNIVSTGYMNLDDACENAGIFSIGTPEQFRGHGYAAAVMKRIINEATLLRIPLLSLQASAAGRQVYLKLGFTDECTIEGWEI